MLYGILNLPWWGNIIAALILTHITIAAVTIYLHRCQAHKSLTLHPIISHFFRFWLWLTTGMVTKEWVAIHRKHHAKCETEDDPHSPQVKGIKKVLFEGAELYREESFNEETVTRYGKGAPNDWLERHVYTPHSALGIGLMFIINLFLFGLPGICIWAVQMAWIPIFAAGVVNGIGHYWGYRNFECNDAARNITPIAIIIGGEELHNNHHAFPTSAKLSIKPWEFDIGWFYIKLMSFLKLAKVNKLPPELTQQKHKAQVDYDTVKALFTNPLQIMASYSKEVIVPVLKQEKKRANDTSKNLFRKARKLLVREPDVMLKEKHKQKLHSLLDQSSQLKTTYQYREQLKAIWKSRASQKELLESLQRWCEQAEATGIEALQRFAARFKGYAPRGKCIR
jgi:stearoyl-CoA desaturase (delta-9 desaturase)